MASKLLRISTFFIIPILVFLFGLIFYFSGTYALFPWLDIPMHFIGGFSIAFMFFLFFRLWKEEGLVGIKNNFIFIFLIVCIVAFFAVCWELWEFIAGNFLGISFFAQESLEDTLFDLFLSLIGGFFGGVISKV
jgi:hypothetical protein